MPIVLLLVGLMMSLAVNSWIPFAVTVVLAAMMFWSMDAFLHDHIHELTKKEEDDDVKTIN